MADTPHFDFPLRRGADGHVAVVEQDSVEDVEARVVAVLYTRTGQLEGMPEFGHPDWTFMEQPIPAAEIAAEILRSVPSASLLIDEAPDRFDALVERVAVAVVG